MKKFVVYYNIGDIAQTVRAIIGDFERCVPGKRTQARKHTHTYVYICVYVCIRYVHDIHRMKCD